MKEHKGAYKAGINPATGMIQAYPEGHAPQGVPRMEAIDVPDGTDEQPGKAAPIQWPPELIEKVKQYEAKTGQALDLDKLVDAMGEIARVIGMVAEQAIAAMNDMGRYILDNCDEDCAGDDSEARPRCPFYQIPDIDEDGNPVPGHCLIGGKPGKAAPAETAAITNTVTAGNAQKWPGVPVMPSITGARNYRGSWRTDPGYSAWCPSCGERLDTEDQKTPAVCPHCGQDIAWPAEMLEDVEK